MSLYHTIYCAEHSDCQVHVVARVDLLGTAYFPIPDGWEVAHHKYCGLHYYCPRHSKLRPPVVGPLLPTEREQLQDRIRDLEAKLEVERIVG